jgi:predicted nucleotidyltransferase component of viral defense system
MEEMRLSKYDKRVIGKKADELGFIRDMLEKVYRLADILMYMNSNSMLKETLALKGGTAINFTVFNLPRLSVDIDLDYLKTVSRDEMLRERVLITGDIQKHMQNEGYELSPKSKHHHSLDSFVFSYASSSGMKDNIKIEINYSMRAHIFPAEERAIISADIPSQDKINSLAVIEIFGSKINALLNRAAARDLYDVNNAIYFKLFRETEYEMLKKCVVFYSAVSRKESFVEFEFEKIDSITSYKIRTDLRPVIRKKENFDLEAAKSRVKAFVLEVLDLTDTEKKFLTCFANKEYMPELLFAEQEILNRIKEHPMALWKMQN